MMLNIEVNNQTESPVADSFFVSITEKTLLETKYDFLSDKEISISVALVSEDEMQRLNKEHRQKDSVTDILSFFEYENVDEIRAVSEKELFLGELILCYDDIKKYAQKQGIEMEKELATVTSHGVLHLLGFSHGPEMFTIQKNVANSI